MAVVLMIVWAFVLLWGLGRFVDCAKAYNKRCEETRNAELELGRGSAVQRVPDSR